MPAESRHKWRGLWDDRGVIKDRHLKATGGGVPITREEGRPPPSISQQPVKDTRLRAALQHGVKRSSRGRDRLM